MDHQGDKNDADPENIPDTPTSLPKLKLTIQPSPTTFDPKTANIPAEPEVIVKQLEESEEILDEEQQEQLQNAGKNSMVESQKSFGLGGIQDEDAYEMEQEEDEYTVAGSQLDQEEGEEEEKELVPQLDADDLDEEENKHEISKEEEVKNDIPQEEYDYLNIDFDYVEETKPQAEAPAVQNDGLGMFGDFNQIMIDVDGKDKDKDKGKKGKDKGKDKDKDKKGKDKDKNQSADKLKKNEKDSGKKGKDKSGKDEEDKNKAGDVKTEGADEITTLKKPEEEGKDPAALAEGEKKNEGAVQGASKDATKEKKEADQKSEGKKSDKAKSGIKVYSLGFK
jgi:hypothetical protein